MTNLRREIRELAKTYIFMFTNETEKLMLRDLIYYVSEPNELTCEETAFYRDYFQKIPSYSHLTEKLNQLFLLSL